MEVDWFGNLNLFLVLVASTSLIGIVMPFRLLRKIGRPWLKFGANILIGFVVLLLVGFCLSAIVQSFTRPNLWGAVWENPTGGFAYILETGAELLSIGIIGLLASSIIVLIRDLRKSGRQ